MHRLTARVLGVVVALLAVIGFFVEGDLLLGFMNVDMTLDILRVVIAVALLIVGFVGSVPDSAVRAVLIIVGLMYIVMGIIAIFDPELFGMLPTGFTPFDVGFHIVVGLASLVIGAMPDRAAKDAAKSVRSGS